MHYRLAAKLSALLYPLGKIKSAIYWHASLGLFNNPYQVGFGIASSERNIARAEANEAIDTSVRSFFSRAVTVD